MTESEQDLTPFSVAKPVDADPGALRVIVVGAGPVGIRFVESLYGYFPNAHVLVCSNEPYRPYNRVQLSAFLSGDISREELDIPLPDTDGRDFNFLVSTIDDINRTDKFVTTTEGHQYFYDKLVIATGAKAYTPTITGHHLTGVYTFRNLKDTEALYARVMRARHIVIVGGGLLGCESAKALLKNNTKITLIQQASHLMNRQLDEEAGGLLQQKLEELGIRVIVNDGVRHVEGDSRVVGIETRSKEYIECDTVLFCTGTSPNTKLALKAKLAVATGRAAI